MSNIQDDTSAQQYPSLLQRFTATGRPMPNPKDTAKGRGMNALNSADSFGQAAPTLLPVRFTDDSIISIPVMPPPPLSQQATSTSTGGFADSSSSLSLVEKDEKKRSGGQFSSFFRRKSHQKSNNNNDGFDFVMKDVARADYLKYYAKDDNGRYIGTEDPAKDCILKNEEDRLRYRSGLQFSNS